MKLPDGPRALSFLQAWQWATRPSEYLDAAAQQYGDIFTAKLPGHGSMIFISDPKALEMILTAAPEVFNSGKGNEMLRPFLGEYALPLLDGRAHQRQRRLLTPPFHGDRMRVYAQLILDLTEQMMQQWQVGETFNLRVSMQEITLRVILNAIFGLSAGERFEQLRQKFMLLLEMITSSAFAVYIFVPALQRDWGPWKTWGKFLRLRQEVDQILYAEIAQRRMQPQSDRTDMLTLLMAARDEQDQPMSDEELRDELITLLVTGQDTTATSMIWALYWIHRVPRVRQRLLAELDSLVAPTKDTAAIFQLPYLTAICQETLRFYPPVVHAAPRITKAPFQLLGYEFPAGSYLIPNIYSAHHRQAVYAEPEAFKPERFLERQFSPYEYLPFGGGNRRCIGYAFAQFQMKLVLATILSRYQLALADRQAVQPIRHGPGLAPAEAVQMRVTALHTSSQSIDRLAVTN